jgi:hypothetical protein
MNHGYFEAQNVGILLSKISSKGKVASSYAQAVNILVKEGLLVSLVKKRDQMSALSIQVPAFFDLSEICSSSCSSSIKQGEDALLVDHLLILGDSIIELNKAIPWSGILRPEDAEGFKFDSIQHLEEALLASGKEGGLLAILSNSSMSSPCVVRAKKVLCNVSVRGDPPVLTGLGALVGLGPGFTPSGDDFLCGVLLGEKIISTAKHPTEKQLKTEPRFPACTVRKGELRARYNGTTSGGKTLLWQALLGHFPFYLIRAWLGIARARGTKEFLEAVRSTAAHGETSGTDALVGLLWYLKYVSENF